MSNCKYLTGENIAPRTSAEAKALIGKKVEYLQNRDIDKSGRGYFFPQTGVVRAVIRREIAIDDPTNFTISLSDLVEMRIIDTPEMKVSIIYSVAPFSDPKYAENSKRLKTHEYGCAICGKPVKTPYEHSAVIVGGGDWARTEAEATDESDPGYMGVWGIGPDCHRKYSDGSITY